MIPCSLLILGTHNPKKGAELSDLLAPLGITVETLAHYRQSIDVLEDGDSFAANAKKKASEQARHLGQWVLGEDSGICIDALEGRPGIYSARFAGPDATDLKNNQLLLDKLGSLPMEQRTAHYSCHMALSDPLGNICAESESHCRGRIRYEEAGNHGFGYDPLFEIIEYHRTFGELGPAMKAAISHRARAIALLLPKLHKLLLDGTGTP